MRSKGRLIGLAIAVAALATITVSAVAATRSSVTFKDGDPLGGMSVANHVSSASDLLDAKTIAWLASIDASQSGAQIGSHLTAAARRIGSLPTGRAVYVVPTTMNRLCVVAAMTADSCGYPLSATNPITLTILDEDQSDGVGPLMYGAAADDVVSVTLTLAGKESVAPVWNNMFVYQGDATSTSDDFGSAVANLSDGTTVTPK